MDRVLFLGEGSSDEGIAFHIERIGDVCGVSIAISVPKIELLPLPDKSVAGKLEAIKKMDGEYDVVIVHRDSDRDGREARLVEIRGAVERVMPEVRHAAVIPVRMTEAWLVLDEQMIRTVAGNPNGRAPLQVPEAARAERIADPKALLKELLVTASELSGRKRRDFQTRFPSHRRLLLERLRPDGPVRSLSSWQHFEDDVRRTFAR